MFDHNRFCHVLDVYTIANLIAHNLRLAPQLVLTILTAAISHDALTPAGGDSVKLIDPPAFDEDKNYHALLQGEGWENFRQRFGVDRDLLIRTVLGEGLLGTILDIADKTAYTARDTLAYLGTARPAKDARNTHMYAIADIVRSDPYVCALWQSAYMFQGRLVFGDKERLSRFLKLRALMFRGLYYNPFARFFEYLVGKGVVKYLYLKGSITRAELLQNGDWWIERKIDEALESEYVLRSFHNLERSRIEEYPDIRSAKSRAADFDGDDAAVVIIDDFGSATKSATQKFFVRKGRLALPFAEACTDEAEEIDDIMHFPKRVRLFIFYADDLCLSPKGRQKLKDILRSVT